jgi:hypothetical protein
VTEALSCEIKGTLGRSTKLFPPHRDSAVHYFFWRRCAGSTILRLCSSAIFLASASSFRRDRLDALEDLPA